MGDPRKTKKQYETPRKPYDRVRLDSERGTAKKYGLKNKRELWRAETTLRKKRENARKLLALPLEERIKREKQLIASLAKLGLLSANSTLDDVLTIKIESILERRLQTMVLRKGLANNIKQARQFIVHGHIGINGKRVCAPNYLVTVEEEGKISYYGKEMKLKPKEVESKAGAKKGFEEALQEASAEMEGAAEENAVAGESAPEAETGAEESAARDSATGEEVSTDGS